MKDENYIKADIESEVKMKINLTKLLDIPERVCRRPNAETIAYLHDTDGSHIVYSDQDTSPYQPYSFEIED